MLTVLSYIKTSSLLLQMGADVLHYKTEKQEQELHVGMDAQLVGSVLLQSPPNFRTSEWASKIPLTFRML